MCARGVDPLHAQALSQPLGQKKGDSVKLAPVAHLPLGQRRNLNPQVGQVRAATGDLGDAPGPRVMQVAVVLDGETCLRPVKVASIEALPHMGAIFVGHGNDGIHERSR